MKPHDPEQFYRFLKRDETFNHFKKIVNGKPEPINLEDLHFSMSGISLNQNVPEDTQDVFEIARQLYIFGYFNYKLFTVSQHYGLLALESALGNKYKILFGKEGTNLKRIIDRLVGVNIISKSEKPCYEAGRDLRNSLSHLTKRKIHTPSATMLVRLAELINKLYS